MLNIEIFNQNKAIRNKTLFRITNIYFKC